MVKPTHDPAATETTRPTARWRWPRYSNASRRKSHSRSSARLDLGDVLEPPQVAGPGFINLRLRNDWLAEQLQAMARRRAARRQPPAEKPKTFVIDYSGPNVAKPMHVGHLRSTIIGDALARLLRFLGHKVFADNHLGDWGTQFGILLYGYKNFLDKEAFATDPVRELARLYLHVRRAVDDEEERRGRGRCIGEPIAGGMSAGDGDTTRGRPRKRAAVADVHAPLLRGNRPHLSRTRRPFRLSTRRELLQPDAARRRPEPCKRRTLPARARGRSAIFFGEDEPPALVRKRDGAFTYTTTDLATIKYRIDNWQPDAMLYVVDSRQALHFQHVFEAARRWGYRDVVMEHVSFGSVLDPVTRKPLKTREGGAPGLEELLDQAIAEACCQGLQRERRRDAARTTPPRLARAKARSPKWWESAR